MLLIKLPFALGGRVAPLLEVLRGAAPLEKEGAGPLEKEGGRFGGGAGMVCLPTLTALPVDGKFCVTMRGVELMGSDFLV